MACSATMVEGSSRLLQGQLVAVGRIYGVRPSFRLYTAIAARSSSEMNSRFWGVITGQSMWQGQFNQEDADRQQLRQPQLRQQPRTRGEPRREGRQRASGHLYVTSEGNTITVIDLNLFGAPGAIAGSLTVA